MKVLFCSQTMDMYDPAMSFFQSWVKHFAPAYEKVTVFCLYQGIVSVPKNVRVFSLGKERYRDLKFRRLLYALRLLYFSFAQRKEYDVVFVHMNQEYILISGLLWKLLGKSVCLWYNHYSGSYLTDIAALLCDKIFYTSRFSYTAKYRQSVQMPVGVDTAKFRFTNSVPRTPNSLLFLGRIAPSKRLDIFVDAMVTTLNLGYECSGSIYGPTVLETDKEYLRKLKQTVHENHLSKKIVFHGGVSTERTPSIYASHSVFVNNSQSGMYDKTLFEAAASGCIVVTTSKDFRTLAGNEHYFDIYQPDQLAQKIIKFLEMSDENLERTRIKMRKLTDRHSLDVLGKQIYFHLQLLL